ncbi:MAG: hypothetical protein RMY00_31525 [Nostoc sp. ChiVER01]|nr:hypothetical protein [Nostoc sp. ChiVER01]
MACNICDRYLETTLSDRSSKLNASKTCTLGHASLKVWNDL